MNNRQTGWHRRRLQIDLLNGFVSRSQEALLALIGPIADLVQPSPAADGHLMPDAFIREAWKIRGKPARKDSFGGIWGFQIPFTRERLGIDCLSPASRSG